MISSRKKCWISLNKELSKYPNSQISKDKILAILETAKKINRENPFCYIENYEYVCSNLKKNPLWISYGGRRTGSTFVFNLLRIIMSSITESFLTGWEGDYSKPIKFFESIIDNQYLESGILKIHRLENDIPRLLNNGKAKAIIFVRDYPNKVNSYGRMLNNKRSPFYKENISLDSIKKFIENEITEEIKKSRLNNCIFVKEIDIRKNTYKIINTISEFLEIKIHDFSIKLISKEFSFDSLLSKQNKIRTNSTGHDGLTFFHHDHLKKDIYNKNYDFIDDLLSNNYGKYFDKDGYLKL